MEYSPRSIANWEPSDSGLLDYGSDWWTISRNRAQSSVIEALRDPAALTTSIADWASLAAVIGLQFHAHGGLSPSMQERVRKEVPVDDPIRTDQFSNVSAEKLTEKSETPRSTDRDYQRGNRITKYCGNFVITMELVVSQSASMKIKYGERYEM